MKRYTYQESISQIDKLLLREEDTQEVLRKQVADIIEDVRENGDEALFRLTEEYDGVSLDALVVTEEEFNEAMTTVSDELITVIQEAGENIRAFHEKQIESTWTYSPEPGIVLGQKVTPIQKVGLYVPGGKAAYPSTVLMDAIPALVAGVSELSIVTPPQKNGKVAPAILAAAQIAGVHRVYKVGGAQAVAALAYGTETVAPVDKIVGPGNIFVALAKREVFGKVAIDMIAGPSEVLVIADGIDTDPAIVAGDLLSQAEHDERAMAILITTDPVFGDAVEAAIAKQLEEDLGRKDIAAKAIADYGFIFDVDNLEEAYALANAIAPEHLEILLENPNEALEHLYNAGAFFIGHYTPEPLGDYFAGPNHTLPTSGTARFSSPLGVYDFIKRSSIIQYDRAALKKVYQKIATFARSEGLDAHALSVERRFQ